MKKVLLVLVLGLAITSCEKPDDEVTFEELVAERYEGSEGLTKLSPLLKEAYPKFYLNGYGYKLKNSKISSEPNGNNKRWYLAIFYTNPGGKNFQFRFYGNGPNFTIDHPHSNECNSVSLTNMPAKLKLYKCGNTLNFANLKGKAYLGK